MFGSCVFGDVVFADVGCLDGTGARRRAIGGSGLPPDWEARMIRASDEVDRKRRDRQQDEEVLALIHAGML